jgi:hypothetical protein
MNPATALAPSLFMPLGTSPHPASAVSKAAAGSAKTAARAKPWAPASAWGPVVHRYLTEMKNGGGQARLDALASDIEEAAHALTYGDYSLALRQSQRALDGLGTKLFAAVMGSGKFQAQPLSINPQWISSLRGFADAFAKKYPQRRDGAAVIRRIADLLEQANQQAPLMTPPLNDVLLNRKTPAAHQLASAITRAASGSPQNFFVVLRQITRN